MTNCAAGAGPESVDKGAEADETDEIKEDGVNETGEDEEGEAEEDALGAVRFGIFLNFSISSSNSRMAVKKEKIGKIQSVWSEGDDVQTRSHGPEALSAAATFLPCSNAFIGRVEVSQQKKKFLRENSPTEFSPPKLVYNLRSLCMVSQVRTTKTRSLTICIPRGNFYIERILQSMEQKVSQLDVQLVICVLEGLNGS